MPQIDDRYVPWLFVAILVSLVALNVEGAMLLMRKQGSSSVWVENDSWLKDGDRVRSDQQSASAENIGDAVRDVLNDCVISGEVIMATNLAAPRLNVNCIDMTPRPPPLPPIDWPPAIRVPPKN